MIKDKCPLCTSNQIKSIFEKNAIFYYRCQACSFVFSGQVQNPNLENQSIENYEPAYISYLEESIEDYRNFANTVKSIERFKPLKNLKVLDVGTGTGKFVRYLRRKSIEAFGIEPSEVLFKRYLSKEPYFYMTDILGLGSVASVVEFDIVVVSDVIEHIADPHSFFRDLYSVLKPEAIVLMSTPDVESWAAKLYGKHWHYINKYHFSFFSRQTINNIASQYGLCELSFKHAARYKSIGYILQYVVDFILKAKNCRTPPFLNNWIIPINLFDDMQVVFQKT